MEQVFVDTSAWFAYANRRDPEHRKVRDVLRAFEGRLVTSNFIFDEILTLCCYRLGHSVAARVGAVLLRSATIDLVRITAGDESQAWHLFLSRSDKAYSFTDCTSFVLMLRLGLATAIALDTDFQKEGFSVLPDQGDG